MAGLAKTAPDANLERRTPPNSLEAEMAVLGGVLLRNDALDQVRDLLDVDDFYQPSHQRLFQTFCALYDRGDAIDPLTVRDELRQRGQFEELGGSAYLERLLDEVHTTANIEQYARIVAEKALLRQLLSATYEVQGMVFEARADDGTRLDVEQILDRSQHKIFDVARETVRSPYEALEKIVGDTLKYVDQRMTARGSLAGYSTGFVDLDDRTNGLKPGELIILAARPAMGKTSLALNVGLNLAVGERLPVLMFSLEMNAVQIGLRLLCSAAEISLSRVLKGQVTDAEYPKLAKAAQDLHEAPFYLDDSGGVNINSIRAKARRLKAEKGNLGLIVIDYIQMMRAVRTYESREREIAELSRNLKLLAKELDCPVLALSQLNRQLENRPDKRPRPSDLRESGSLEQDADVILFLYRDSAYWTEEEKQAAAQELEAREPNKTELIIGKQRSGPTDTVMLTFRGEITRFEDYTQRVPYR
jgi:replicative DNA helicase